MKHNNLVIDELWQIIQSKKDADINESWTAKLFDHGLEKICKKTGEEAIEVLLAAQEEKNEHLVYESCDLIYHLLVLLAYKNVDIEDVYKELQRRFSISGIEEKNSRETN